MEAVLADFDRRNPDEDPVIHFYELFLKEYDAAQKVKRGVFYTPRPVVGFIVRSVDEVLRTEFGLEDGLASTATWGEVIAASKGREGGDITLPEGAKEGDPFVRILDPATGTGTFLVECVDLIHKTMLRKWSQQGLGKGPTDPRIKALWNAYVREHLLPRLTGFELMMAPYAIAHVKLGLKLADTGYAFGSDARAQIYLTNALEPPQDMDMQLAFMSEALAHEAKAANAAKTTRFTVVVGNPPYSNSATNNRNAWITDQISIYKEGLNEKKLNLDDDYIKFIRFSENTIFSSGAGLVGLITNSSYLDGLVHRRMRQSLLESFTYLSIFNLHGNSRRLEKSATSEADENIFAIQQGVAIVVGARAATAARSYADLWGSSDTKLKMLAGPAQNFSAIPISPAKPMFWFVLAADPLQTPYGSWSAVTDTFPMVGSGLNTDRDELCIDFDQSALKSRMQTLFSGKYDSTFVRTYSLAPTSSYRPLDLAAKQTFDEKALHTVLARPFDIRHIYYKPGFTSRPVFEVQGNMLGKNVALLVSRQSKEGFAVLATNQLSMHKIVTVYDRTSSAPLWLQAGTLGDSRRPNIAPAFAARVATLTGLAYDDCVECPKQGALGGILPKKAEQTAMFAPARRERGEPGRSFGPRDLFDYIYAVLHSPAYRTRYAEYLKSDFARIPLPGSRALFEAMVPLGIHLVALHLLDEKVATELADPKTVRLAGPGDKRVTRKAADFEGDAWEGGRMYISASQWFETVPERVANFHVGGYRPARKWLKDRTAKGGKKQSDGRVLTAEDILHYRRMIVAMDKTIELMAEVDRVVEAHGGWPEAFRGMTDDA